MVTFRALLANTFLASILPGSVLAQACESLATIQWILGDWQAEDDSAITRESWQQVSPSTFEGRGEVRSKPADRRSNLETLRLVEMSAGVYYLAKVSHNDLPVAFAATSCSDTTAVFANAKHDFPKRIAYRLAEDDHLVVDVSDGGSRGFTIEFERQW